MRDHIVAIDQGTTSSRVVVYDAGLVPRGQAQREILPSYPRPEWVEHDPEALAEMTINLIGPALRDAGVDAGRVAALGITNQRETAIVWDRSTGQAIHPALVWQDRRTADACRDRAAQADEVAGRTGLVIHPYFSATKWAWILDNVPGARAQAEAGALAAGTVDSWLTWRLTRGRSHLIDVTNASRTLLMDLRRGAWDPWLCQLFAVPGQILPEIVASTGNLAVTLGVPGLPDGLPIAGIAGDQQAALVGQGGFAAGTAKCTYGTGAFLLVHTGEGPIPSRHGLITTAAASPDPARPQFALEGSIFIAGAAVQWFRDGLRAIGASAEIGELSLGASERSGLLFVPALTGLGAPHWSSRAQGTIFGITPATTLADLARATLEGVAYQVADLLTALEADRNRPLDTLRVDGGMARCDPFLQFQADLLGVPIERGADVESTAKGAAALAGIGAGLFDREGAERRLAAGRDRFLPGREFGWREQSLRTWQRAVAAVRRYYEATDSEEASSNASTASSKSESSKGLVM